MLFISFGRICERLSLTVSVTAMQALKSGQSAFDESCAEETVELPKKVLYISFYEPGKATSCMCFA